MLTYILTSVKLAVKKPQKTRSQKRGHEIQHHKNWTCTRWQTTVHGITAALFCRQNKFSSHTGKVHQSECTSDSEGEERCQASGYDSSHNGIRTFSKTDKVFDRRCMVAAPYIPPRVGENMGFPGFGWVNEKERFPVFWSGYFSPLDRKARYKNWSRVSMEINVFVCIVCQVFDKTNNNQVW